MPVDGGADKHGVSGISDAERYETLCVARFSTQEMRAGDPSLLGVPAFAEIVR